MSDNGSIQFDTGRIQTSSGKGFLDKLGEIATKNSAGRNFINKGIEENKAGEQARTKSAQDAAKHDLRVAQNAENAFMTAGARGAANVATHQAKVQASTNAQIAKTREAGRQQRATVKAKGRTADKSTIVKAVADVSKSQAKAKEHSAAASLARVRGRQAQQRAMAGKNPAQKAK